MYRKRKSQDTNRYSHTIMTALADAGFIQADAATTLWSDMLFKYPTRKERARTNLSNNHWLLYLLLSGDRSVRLDMTADEGRIEPPRVQGFVTIKMHNVFKD